eukprot:TRINITY_DN828_c0_g1::TRINITY_DN828_c0_g1_i1::g.25423::m.25423 TRINITY_DN828_c0_g1::TRINITY_DN828_c0_g1_i1::g.25423  ORF type:complete len:652 (+),score=267.73,sp/Q93VT8/ACLB1_ORYSJ/66.83/0.0,Citrate_synt/PF00285.16/5.8,Citrate_synt/PF00285.16/1.2e-20,Ligase_CoA/PF00549.14/1.5e-12,Succ_CoA_lig/PF13607.1/0.00028,NTPase_P4/PF11602.3/0.0037,NTPase_P4/PF11602.3/3.5e+03 TRINITY_DN828_c0_g1_i1:84-1958(+)
MAAWEPPTRLFSKTTQAIIYNFKPNPVQRMLDFDWACSRTLPSVAGLVQPGVNNSFNKFFFGKKEIVLPTYGSTKAAAEAQPKADVFINFASFRSAYESSLEALHIPTIRTVVIIAEGVPEKDVKMLIRRARELNKIIIGPATVGGLQAGAFKVGDTAGTIDNIIECGLHRAGSVGFVSKSGGMSNELYNVLSRTTDGLYEGIAIGGDVFPGSGLCDHVLRFQRIDEIKMIVVLGELGGQAEYQICDLLKSGKVTKPVVAWVTGTCAALFPTEVQFGHAGAKSGGQAESAEAKNAALRASGAHVPDSFEGLAQTIRQVFQGLVDKGLHVPIPKTPAPIVPKNMDQAMKEGTVRKPTSIISTISDDRGDEPKYGGFPMSQLMEDGATVGDVISLLWFKKRLPVYATRFIQMIIMLTADHGPCVSGAHNTIVCARAGKDIVSCLTSGLLTIGPRFGGAIDDAARGFRDAKDKGMEPDEYVEAMKKRGKRIAGIGHRIKNADNRDARVLILSKYARDHFPSCIYLDYAEAVEKYTLQKSSNLVLNVDGCIGALFCDLLQGCKMFTNEEIDEVINLGTLNGLFVLARSIGLIGHALDQKRLKQPLYRHPWDDVLYGSEWDGTGKCADD